MMRRSVIMPAVMAAAMMFLSMVSLARDEKKTYKEFTGDPAMTCREGLLKIYAKDSDIFLEIPDSLMGRKLMVSTVVTSDKGGIATKGSLISRDLVFTISRIDTTIVLSTSPDNMSVDSGCGEIRRALELSATGAVAHTLPMACRSDSAAASIVNINKVLDPSDKKVASLTGFSDGSGLLTISGSKFNPGFSARRGIDAFDRTAGVYWEAVFDCSLTVLFYTLKSTESIEMFTSLTLLPESDYVPRLADSRVGTRTATHTIFSDRKGTEKKNWAVRWNARKEGDITIYIDPTLPEVFREAATEGILAWNEGFRAAGLGDVIKVLPFYEGMRIEDPLTSKVIAGSRTGKSLRGSLSADSLTGEIMSCNISIPGNYIEGIRDDGMIFLADVDERFDRYDIPEDAVRDMMRSEVMCMFGQLLGVSSNHAGSWAWSPEQIRDPEFTAANGFSASVTDDATFNILARPGDKERGVKLFHDGIGVYDRWAMEWLYNPSESKEVLDGILARARGREELQYVGRDSMGDPRAGNRMLGNDVNEWYRTCKAHIDYAFDHGNSWVSGKEVNDDFRMLFSERVFNAQYALGFYASYAIGGIFTYDTRNGYPVTSAIPAEEQRSIAETIARGVSDYDSSSRNREFLWKSGPYPGYLGFSKIQFAAEANIIRRIDSVMRAYRAGISDFSPGEYLRINTDILLEPLRTRTLDCYDNRALETYINYLASCSTAMKESRKSSGGHLTELSDEEMPFPDEEESESFALKIQIAPRNSEPELAGYCIVEMEYLLKELSKAERKYSGQDRRRIHFLVRLCENSLTNYYK